MPNIISKFCNIGIAVLHRAVGLQSNYKTTEYEPYQILDENATGCPGCPYYIDKQLYSSFPDSEPFRTAQNSCDQCDRRCFTTAYKTVDTYINEANRYGRSERLPSSVLLLYLLLHFITPDLNGIIKHTDIKWAAETLGVTVKTVINNIQRLTDFGYICTCNTGVKGYTHVLISKYKDMYKKASEGGRGYITFSDELFMELLKIENVNLLRITLKNLLETESVDTASQAAATIQKDYAELRRYLPDYCKPNVINHILEKKTDIFECRFEGYGFSFTVKDNYYCKKVKKDQLQQNSEQLVAAISAINEASQSDSKIASPAIYKIFGRNLLAATLYVPLPPLAIDDIQIKAIASISIQYGLNTTLDALGRLYTDYICAGETVNNPGGLIRTLCRNNLSHLGIA